MNGKKARVPPSFLGATGSNMAYCKYCGSLIDWMVTASGAKMSVDPDLISSDDCEHGDVLVTEEGQTIKVDHSKQDYESFDGFVSHFATCTEYENFKR